jgi:hypothetical protein
MRQDSDRPARLLTTHSYVTVYLHNRPDSPPGQIKPGILPNPRPARTDPAVDPTPQRMLA